MCSTAWLSMAYWIPYLRYSRPNTRPNRRRQRAENAHCGRQMPRREQQRRQHVSRHDHPGGRLLLPAEEQPPPQKCQQAHEEQPHEQLLHHAAVEDGGQPAPHRQPRRRAGLHRRTRQPHAERPVVQTEQQPQRERYRQRPQQRTLFQPERPHQPQLFRQKIPEKAAHGGVDHRLRRAHSQQHRRAAQLGQHGRQRGRIVQRQLIADHQIARRRSDRQQRQREPQGRTVLGQKSPHTPSPPSVSTQKP